MLTIHHTSPLLLPCRYHSSMILQLGSLYHSRQSWTKSIHALLSELHTLPPQSLPQAPLVTKAVAFSKPCELLHLRHKISLVTTSPSLCTGLQHSVRAAGPHTPSSQQGYIQAPPLQGFAFQCISEQMPPSTTFNLCRSTSSNLHSIRRA